MIIGFVYWLPRGYAVGCFLLLSNLLSNLLSILLSNLLSILRSNLLSILFTVPLLVIDQLTHGKPLPCPIGSVYPFVGLFLLLVIDQMIRQLFCFFYLRGLTHPAMVCSLHFIRSTNGQLNKPIRRFNQLTVDRVKQEVYSSTHIEAPNGNTGWYQVTQSVTADGPRIGQENYS